MKRLLPILFLFGCGPNREPCPVITRDTVIVESPTTCDSVALYYEDLLDIKNNIILYKEKENQKLKNQNNELKAQIDTLNNADVYEFLREYVPVRHKFDSL